MEYSNVFAEFFSDYNVFVKFLEVRLFKRYGSHENRLTLYGLETVLIIE